MQAKLPVPVSVHWFASAVRPVQPGEPYCVQVIAWVGWMEVERARMRREVREVRRNIVDGIVGLDASFELWQK